MSVQSPSRRRAAGFTRTVTHSAGEVEPIQRPCRRVKVGSLAGETACPTYPHPHICVPRARDVETDLKAEGCASQAEACATIYIWTSIVSRKNSRRRSGRRRAWPHGTGISNLTSRDRKSVV